MNLKPEILNTLTDALRPSEWHNTLYCKSWFPGARYAKHDYDIFPVKAKSFNAERIIPSRCESNSSCNVLSPRGYSFNPCVFCSVFSPRPACKGVEGLARVGSRAALSFAFAFLRRAWRSGERAAGCWQWRRCVSLCWRWQLLMNALRRVMCSARSKQPKLFIDAVFLASACVSRATVHELL